MVMEMNRAWRECGRAERARRRAAVLTAIGAARALGEDARAERLWADACAAGIWGRSRGTLERAAGDLKVEKGKTAHQGQSFWRLPGPQIPPAPVFVMPVPPQERR